MEEWFGDPCPCGIESKFDDCCYHYLAGKTQPSTAETLMRSRYTAFVTQEVDYIYETHDPDTRGDVDVDEIRSWSEAAYWEGLNVVAIAEGAEKDSKGKIEFVAHYSMNDKEQHHHEVADFNKKDGRWYFTDGAMVDGTYKREGPKVGRNDPCSCGSGKKFKKCCG
jgi:SEC-C motif-containing protein